MNPKSRTTFPENQNRIPWLPAAALLYCLGSDQAARAQSVFAPTPELSSTPPALQQAQHNELQVFPPPDVVPIPETPPFAVGPVNLRPHVAYRFLSGDGIPARSNHVSSVIQEFSPGLLLGLGTHWTLDYTPTW